MKGDLISLKNNEKFKYFSKFDEFFPESNKEKVEIDSAIISKEINPNNPVLNPNRKSPIFYHQCHKKLSDNENQLTIRPKSLNRYLKFDSKNFNFSSKSKEIIEIDDEINENSSRNKNLEVKETSNKTSSTVNRRSSENLLQSNTSNNKRTDFNTLSIYDRSMKMLENKEKKINLSKLNKSRNEEIYPFSPDLSLTKSYSNIFKNRQNSNSPIYIRTHSWNVKKLVKQKKITEELEKIESDKCTYRPAINPSILRDSRGVNKTNEINKCYFLRMNRSREKKKEFENICKKVYHYGEKYKNKRTIFKEFELSSSNFNKEFKNESFVRTNEKQRKIFKTNDFFVGSKSFENKLFDDYEYYNKTVKEEKNIKENFYHACSYLQEQLFKK